MLAKILMTLRNGVRCIKNDERTLALTNSTINQHLVRKRPGQSKYRVFRLLLEVPHALNTLR